MKGLEDPLGNRRRAVARFRALLALALLAGALSGCATLFAKRTKGVEITSDPDGAEVLINGESRGRTPLFVDLRQKEKYSITFRAQGHDDKTYLLENHVRAGWVILDIIPAGIPIIVDAATGHWKSLNDDAVHGVLPESRMPAAPDSVSAGVVPKGEAGKVAGAAATITLQDGTVLAARSVESSGATDLKVTLMDGTTTFVGIQKIRAILDADGVNRADEVITKGKRIP